MDDERFEILDSPIEVKRVLENLSAHDFRDFGLHQIAYIRSSQRGGYIVYGADGCELFSSKSLEGALLETMRDNLEPVAVH